MTPENLLQQITERARALHKTSFEDEMMAILDNAAEALETLVRMSEEFENA
jgi:hypothetical protein